ncbi:spore coat protein GerQ [Sporolactobacillus sp. THM7-4]|nr:spore coat protein GerQ [Sporolactobacillus sp. THM7-4]
MSQPFPPENWPYGSSYYPGNEEASSPEASREQVPTQSETASYPFTGQFTTPLGGQPAATPGALPYSYPSYTIPTGAAQPGAIPGTMPGTAPGAALPLVEQSYIENILRLNLGKKATLYATFEGNTKWNAMSFSGTVEAAGRDHVIIVDRTTGTRYLIPMVFVNYFTFEEPLSYSYPFAAQPTGR